MRPQHRPLPLSRRWLPKPGLRSPTWPIPILRSASNNSASALVDSAKSDEDADKAFDLCVDHEERMTALRATTPAGAAAGPRVAIAKYHRFKVDCGKIGASDRFIVTLIENAFAVLEREVAHG